MIVIGKKICPRQLFYHRTVTTQLLSHGDGNGKCNGCGCQYENAESEPASPRSTTYNKSRLNCIQLDQVNNLSHQELVVKTHLDLTQPSRLHWRL